MIYLVDGPVYVFRGWFALPDSILSPSGEAANAFRGFADFLMRLLEHTGEAPVAVAFDESLTHCFRNEIHAAYKASREMPPPELERQFVWCRQLCRAMGVMELASERFEADDLIASLANIARRDGQAVTVVSRDKDLIQVLRPGDHLLAGPGEKDRDYATLATELGFAPERMSEVQALTGDPIDDIPGVPGIGQKTAARLMTHFPDLESLYADIDQHGAMALEGLKLRGQARIMRLLIEHRDSVFQARRLTRLYTDLDLPRPGAGQREHDQEALALLDREAGLGGRLREKWLNRGK